MARTTDGYDDPEVWAKLDPASQQVHLLRRIAEDTKDIRSILNILLWASLVVVVLVILYAISSAS
jgi:hypothetical protein